MNINQYIESRIEQLTMEFHDAIKRDKFKTAHARSARISELKLIQNQLKERE